MIELNLNLRKGVTCDITSFSAEFFKKGKRVFQYSIPVGLSEEVVKKDYQNFLDAKGLLRKTWMVFVFRWIKGWIKRGR